MSSGVQISVIDNGVAEQYFGGLDLYVDEQDWGLGNVGDVGCGCGLGDAKGGKGGGFPTGAVVGGAIGLAVGVGVAVVLRKLLGKRRGGGMSGLGDKDRSWDEHLKARPVYYEMRLNDEYDRLHGKMQAASPAQLAKHGAQWKRELKAIQKNLNSVRRKTKREWKQVRYHAGQRHLFGK